MCNFAGTLQTEVSSSLDRGVLQMVWPIAFAVISLFFNWADFFVPLNLPNGLELVVDVLLGLVLGFLFSTLLGLILPKRWQEYSRRPLTQVSKHLPETCYVGRGVWNGDLYFGWKTKDDGKFHSVRTYTALEIAVVDTQEPLRPELRMFKQAFTHPVVYLLAIEPHTVMYEFHVPPGTYNADLPDGTFM